MYFCAIPVPANMHRANVYTYCLCIGAIGSKLDGHGVEHAHLPRHLLHAPHCTLLVRIRKLHHQAWRGSLQDRKQKETCKGISQVHISSCNPYSTHGLGSVGSRWCWFFPHNFLAFCNGPLQEAKGIRKERTLWGVNNWGRQPSS